MKSKKAYTGKKPFEGIVPKEKRYAHGNFLRQKFPLEMHAVAHIENRPDPVAIFTESSKNRISKLMPLLHERVLESPFTFYRGNAGIMASDLSLLPSTNMKIQVCGDCHLLNFGGFATPERKLIFDINDFDQTAVAPWEWDVKRLAASFVIAGRDKGFTEEQCTEAARKAVRSYRKQMAVYAEMSALQIWYHHIELTDIIKSGKLEDAKQFKAKEAKRALLQLPHEKDFAKLTYRNNKQPKIKDQLPLIFHASPESEEEFYNQAELSYTRYLKSLSQDRRALLQRYKIQDVALKVVGVGSVGTFCGITLLMSATGDPLFLQFKEACQSVLEPFTGRSRYLNHGQRVVEGQRLIQSASDIFLGWTTNDYGQHFYVRQLRDAKVKPALGSMSLDTFMLYAKSCGWALSRAHARTGDPVILSGYMGTDKLFDEAISAFATSYANQNEKDYALMIEHLSKKA
ncbi:DUF2252 domain-containing protein [Flavobacterium rhizosphaerae]|uniref:DUF2252 domain-containing protein n=1 Tax=Flavobacterium rhizosphaerae TaxID=3163298 RepID=A0ABW8YRV5_9FLAO